jgi:hypothetical protein
MGVVHNDEPVYDDRLGHNRLVIGLGGRIAECNPPYVVGVCGPWGSGKTSFLKKLWAYLGGAFDVDGASESKRKANRKARREEWFGANVCKDIDGQVESWTLVWFNPWQHQFEANPVVALLHEIRKQFSLRKRAFDEAGKLTDVTVHATINMLGEIGKALSLPLPGLSTKPIMERGREYEAEHYMSPLSSQVFRDFFEGAIRQVVGNGRLVVFIDDLDRCEGEVAYRVLESLKLYLNASNCVFILGVDQEHLERTVARVLSGEKDASRFRPLARSYLNKMFQGLFLLPTPENLNDYIKALVDADAGFQTQFSRLFGEAYQEPAVVRALDENLPPNPRQVKAFVSTWKLHLSMLDQKYKVGDAPLSWRLTVILNYFAQFEEPLFRKVEAVPGFYADRIVRFCQTGASSHPLLADLEAPVTPTPTAADEVSGGLGAPPVQVAEKKEPAKDDKATTLPRPFWISNLVRELDLLRTGSPFTDSDFRRHFW